MILGGFLDTDGRIVAKLEEQSSRGFRDHVTSPNPCLLNLSFHAGVATGVSPMYISEISPVSVKGAVGVSHQFMITFGILVSFGLGWGTVSCCVTEKRSFRQLSPR